MKLTTLILLATMIVPAISHAENWVKTERLCGVTAVRIQVVGDNARVSDLAVKFGNGKIQDLQTVMAKKIRDDVQNNPRDPHPRILHNGDIAFDEKSNSPWLDLRGDQRCIDGFFFDARSDKDHDRAYIVLRGLNPVRINPKDRSVSVNEDRVIGVGNIKEFNRTRGNWRPRHDGDERNKKGHGYEDRSGDRGGDLRR